MDIQPLIHSLSGLNWQAIVAIFIVVWFFTKDLRKGVEETLREVKSIHADLKTMNTRISRLEGTTYGQQLYKLVDKE